MRWRWATIGLAAAVLAAGLTGAAVWRAERAENSAPEIANPFLPPGVVDRGWPFVRGADFDGHSPEMQLADAWPAGGPPIVWRRTLGEGYSSLVAGGGRVYTQYQDAGGQFVVCLDVATGETVWRYRYDWPFGLGEMYPGPRATPTLAHGRIYFAGPSGLVGCLNDRGRLVWSVNVTEKFDGQGTGFGYSCSPTVVDDLVILPVGSKGAAMVALNAHDGSVAWRGGDQSASYTPAYPIMVDGQRQVVGYMENTVVGHDLATGEQLWVHELSKGYDEHAAWPIFHDGYLWIAAPFQVGSELLKLSGGQGASAVSVRPSKIMSNDVASSVLIGEHIYGFDLCESQTKRGRPSRGTFRCIDFHTGEVRWSQGDAERRRVWPPRDGRDDAAELPIGHASFLVADGKLILLNDTGELILARATPERYEELGRATVLADEICWTSPALHGGCVFARNHAEAVCVYVGSPELCAAMNASTRPPPGRSWSVNLQTLATALGVRPSDTHSIPSIRQFVSWYGFSLATIAIALPMAWMVGFILAAKSVQPKLASCANSKPNYRILFLASLMLSGFTGPLVLSRWSNAFIFTWPVVIFAVLLATVEALPLAHRDANAARVRRRSLFVVSVFAAVCGLYFLACRELGLRAQWTFLTGFAAALPIAIIAKIYARRTPLPWPLNLILDVLGFTAYYWASVGLMVWAVPYD